MVPARQTILFLTVRADFGGGSEHLWQLLKNMSPDVQVRVACPRDYPYYERYRDYVGEKNIVLLPHRRFCLSALWRLRTFCREHDVTVLHSHGKGAGLYSRTLALLTGLPCVHTFHGIHMAEYGFLKKGLYRFAEKGMALFTRAGITVSKGEMEQILAEGLMPEAKLHCIENGVPVPRAAVSLPDTPPYSVVSISRFDAAKNSAFLVAILVALRQRGRLDDFRFIAVGDGPGRIEVQNLARRQGVGDVFKFVGATLEPHSFFNGAMAYLSTSRWEGMPLAVLEAMGHGLPVAVTDVVGNRDVVTNGETGFIYHEGNAIAAADALCRLADDPVLRQTIAARAREYVMQRHDVRAMASATFDLLCSQAVF